MHVISLKAGKVRRLGHMARTGAVSNARIIFVWRLRRRFKFKFKLIYDRQSVGQSILVPGTRQGPVTNFFSLLEIFFRYLRVC
jgi:hypothetical protein